MVLLLVVLVIVGIGIMLASVQVFLTCWTLRGKSLARTSMPGRFRVSILKPLCGLEDGLEENLESFTRLRNGSYEVVLSIADHSDPALEVVNRVLKRYPDAPFSLLVGGPVVSGVTNPKVERLITAAAAARGEILFISDSNIRVSPEDVSRTVALFGDPSVGCVSNPFVAEGSNSFGAIIEGLHLLTFVLPGNALANAFRVPCVVGKSMAITREVCTAIGGFQAFLHLLAEDQAIAVAINRAGYRVILAPVVVRNVIVQRRLREALARQIRWNKIRFSFSPLLYTCEFLLNPLPVAFLACGFLAATAPELSGMGTLLVGAVSFLRWMQGVVLAQAAGAGMPFLHLLLVPVQDLLQFVVQFAPYLSQEVNWRGHKARLGPGTLLLPSTSTEVITPRGALEPETSL